MAERKRRILFTGLIAALLFIGAAVWLVQSDFLETKSQKSTSSAASAPEGLNAEKKSQTLLLYQDFSGSTFADAKGQAVPLSEKLAQGKPLILVYWTSWCPYCQKELQTIDERAKEAEQAGAQLILINKLEGTKETYEQALTYLKQNSIQTESLFDEDAKQYKAYGLNMVPTLLVVDVSGRLTSFSEGKVPDKEALLSMITEAKTGKSQYLLQMIEKNLLNEVGGVKTEYLASSSGTVPSGGDVLSESQGLLMQYAQQAKNKDLFDKVWSYTQNHMTAGGLPAWVTQYEKQPAMVTATVDDLRIYHALYQFNPVSEQLKQYANAIDQYEVNNQNLVDFYDFALNQQASRFTLCYADFEALLSLAKNDSRFQAVYDNSLKLVKNGRISEDFPLYNSYYDLNEKKYKTEQLNLSEAMLTLLHLSQIGQLPKEAMDWVEARMDEGYLYARYDSDGRASENGLYESTGTYALVAQLAFSENRPQVAQAALSRMEALRVRQISNQVDGAFGNPDGSGIYSFDQCMALLAYQQMEQVLGEQAH